MSAPGQAVAADASVFPDVIFGSGNPNGDFTVDHNVSGVEIGLRASIPFAGVYTNDGAGTYTFSLPDLFAPMSDLTHPWNFDWAINTNVTGTTGYAIDDLTYILDIDCDPAAGVTSFLSFDPIVPSNSPAMWWDHSIGINTTSNGGGTEVNNPLGADPVGDYATLIMTDNVVQNSWRQAFFPVGACSTYDPLVAGEYTIVLSAFDLGTSPTALASASIVVEITGVAVPTLSEWGVIAMSVLMLGAVLYLRRQRGLATAS